LEVLLTSKESSVVKFQDQFTRCQS
jgi:hypothetical protein